MGRFTHPEWLARNALRAYPLCADSPRTSHRGFRLPDDLLVDAQLVLTSPCPQGIFLRTLNVSPRLVSVVLADVASGAALAAATVVVDPAAVTGTVSAPLRPVSSRTDTVAGRLVFGPALSAGRFAGLLAAAGAGNHFFDASLTLANRTLVRTDPFPVRSLNGAAGDVTVRFGQSFVLAQDTVVNLDGDTTRVWTVGLADPPAFLSPCASATVGQCNAPLVRSINGVPPDPATGDVRVDFVGFSAVRTVGSSTRVLQLQAGGDLCAGAVALPDSQGRLPPDYAQDQDPTTPY